MPKERFHLLISDEYLKSRQIGGKVSKLLRTERLAFFLGAISPDIFLYDLPSFELGALGDSLHDLMERRGPAPIQDWLFRTRGRGAVPEAAFAWGLGFASHFLADALWHPVIDSMVGSLDFCKKKGLAALGCHRLIESEMEAFWLARIGGDDPRQYVGLLKRFTSEQDLLGRIVSSYRDFLRDAGLAPLPSAHRIRRCFLSQNFLLRLFSNRTLGNYRDRLLDARTGRYLGVLVTPRHPLLPMGALAGVTADRDPFTNEFMAKGITSLNAHLSDFEEELAQYLPS